MHNVSSREFADWARFDKICNFANASLAIRKLYCILSRYCALNSPAKTNFLALLRDLQTIIWDIALRFMIFVRKQLNFTKNGIRGIMKCYGLWKISRGRESDEFQAEVINCMFFKLII